MKILLLALLFCIWGPDITAQTTAADFCKKGVELKGQKKIPEAVTAFKEAVRLKSGYSEAQYELGWCYNDLKQYKDAMNSLRAARIGWPTIPKVHAELGYAFEKLNFTDSAVKSYNRCLELKADYAMVHKQLGYIAYEKDDYTTAIDRFTKYELYVKNEIKEYLFWYRKGFCYNALKQYDQAKTALTKSMEYKKDYLNTYLELGYANSRLKENDIAISWYKKAMEIDPKSHVPLNGIGEVYRDNIKNIPEAMSWYKKTLALNPTERKGNFGMGYCLNSTQKYAEAIPYLRTAIESEPTYAAAFVELGYSYFRTNDNTRALENFNKAISLSPGNENARYYKGLVFIAQKDKASAQKMLEELKGLKSNNAALLQEKIAKL
jgi:superkiller protein 3